MFGATVGGDVVILAHLPIFDCGNRGNFEPNLAETCFQESVGPWQRF